MPRSWKEYAESEGFEPKPEGVAEFFRRRPEVLAEVLEAKESGGTWSQILRWLQEEHGLQVRTYDAVRRAAL